MPPEQLQKHGYGQGGYVPVNGNGNSWQNPPQRNAPPAVQNNPYQYPVKQNPHRADLPQKAYPTHYVQPGQFQPTPPPQPTYIQPTVMAPVYAYPQPQAPTQSAIQIISLNGSQVN